MKRHTQEWRFNQVKILFWFIRGILKHNRGLLLGVHHWRIQEYSDHQQDLMHCLDLILHCLWILVKLGKNTGRCSMSFFLTKEWIQNTYVYTSSNYLTELLGVLNKKIINGKKRHICKILESYPVSSFQGPFNNIQEISGIKSIIFNVFHLLSMCIHPLLPLSPMWVKVLVLLIPWYVLRIEWMHSHRGTLTT